MPSSPTNCGIARGLAAAAGLATLLATASVASAQDKTIELKLAHWVPASHPLHKGFEEWAQ